MRPDRDSWAMALAVVTAQRATCLRRQVGSVLLNARGHVLATGYNGVAAGQKHCNEVTGEIINPDLKMPNGVFRSAEHWERETIKVHAHSCPGAKAASGTNLDGCHAIHAETNALMQCRDVYEIDSIYVTSSPCISCTKMLLNTSCRRVVFLGDYPHPASKDLWVNSGRIWEKFNGKFDFNFS